MYVGDVCKHIYISDLQPGPATTVMVIYQSIIWLLYNIVVITNI